MTGAAGNVRAGWRVSASRAARRLAAVTAAGALLGLLVGGVGGRLGMTLLAVRNPQATGVMSDDEFRMGQFTLSGTLNLLLFATLTGVVGGAIYLVVRPLMIGPRWFQILSISGGPAVVVGAILVHTGGVDFTLLQPAELAIGLFVVIPLVFAALLSLLGDRLLGPDGWFARASPWAALAPLLIWIPLFPFFVVLVLAWLMWEWSLRLRLGRTALGHPLATWTARLVLALLFVTALFDLAQDTAALT